MSILKVTIAAVGIVILCGLLGPCSSHHTPGPVAGVTHSYFDANNV
jgi:hypothetical protein